MTADDRPLLTRLVDIAWADLAAHDPSVLHAAAARALFDSLVCMAAGARSTQVVPEEERGPVPLVGTHRSGGLLGSVAANAIAAHTDDLDDIHWPSVTHPGSVLWPSLLAVGCARGIPATQLFSAAAFGYQVAARAAALFGPDHRRKFHASSTSGALAVAAAVSIAINGDPDDAVTAMSHAASGLGGTAQALREHSRTAMLHRGFSASIGVLAALHRHLVPAVTAALSGPYGLCEATTAQLDLNGLAGRSDAALLNLTMRRHPVTGFAHCLVDAILDAGPFDPSAVVGLEAEVPAFVVALTEPGPPIDVHTAAWSLPHSAAVAMAGELPAGRLQWPPTPVSASLRERVMIEPRDATPPDLAVRGQLRLADGSAVEVARTVPYGHPDDPWTDADLISKAARLGVASSDDGAALLDQLTEATSTVITGRLLDVLSAPTAAQPTGYVLSDPGRAVPDHGVWA